MAYPIAKLIIPPIYSLWIRKVEGIDNIPKDKPFIIAANHSSYFDIFIPPTLIIPKVNKKIYALVNSYYWKPFITRIFLNMWGAIPVFIEKEKNAKEKNKQAFEKALNHLKNKELIMVFPEGRRSHNGKLQKSYTGIAKLSLKSKVPVLPVGIIGANKVLPVGKSFPRFVRCEAKIGKLIYFERYYNKKITERVLESVTRSIMKQIARLIGQKYIY